MEECPVCYEDLILTKGGQCRHKVCVECLDNIKKNNGLCPLCREVWHYTVPRDSNSDTEMDQAERIRLVMEQTGSTREETIDALLQNSNDIFNAIMDLVIDAPFDLTS